MKRADSPWGPDSSEELPKSGLRGVSKGWYSGQQDTRIRRSYYEAPTLEPTHELNGASMLSFDAAAASVPQMNEQFERTESPRPMSSAQQQNPAQMIVGYADQGKSVSRAKIQEQDLKEMKENAFRYFQNGSLTEARRLYSILIEWHDNQERPFIDRNYYRMQLHIGRIDYIQGHYKRSQSMLTELLRAQCKRSLAEPSEVSLASEIAH
ncbi:hypothetical protein K458DRAFT_38998 [Lentithecium fluviatile CBS 122367]|uniref:Uncharacterized protein n=1 Tax=Lentithecium fluviatile CBS 122367 TaxID=1168545 RepID=A0A6G1J146_9PLEO|nr:hypothetical protein K458DRAFT_38998 [Lentithecium fluviatile CBS 122367]